MTARRNVAPRRRRRCWLGLVASLGLLVASCASPVPPDTTVMTAITPDFFGEVASVTRGEGWSVHPAGVGRGGLPGSPTTRVGPATIDLVGGTRLYVRADTPGGNFCVPFLDQADMDLYMGFPVTREQFIGSARHQGLSERCAIIGEFADDGSVEWFYVLEIVLPTSSTVAVGGTLEIRGPDVVVGTAGGSLLFPISEHVTVDCRLRHATEDIAALLADGQIIEAHADLLTGEIIKLQCLPHD